MDGFLWLISHFSCRIAVVLLSVLDFLGLGWLYQSSVLKTYVNTHIPLLVTIGITTIILSIIFAILGGKAGYEYVNMERSRRWLYRSTAFSRGDNTFMNVLYWACKFALLPIILVLFIFFIFIIIKIISYC